LAAAKSKMFWEFVIELFHRDFGGAGKPPLVILHGLLGSSRNWQTVGADLAASQHVLAVDLRNHGLSPHAADQDYALMEADLERWMETQSLASAVLLGHSMGGKLSMALACHRPQRVAALVVVDIAPRHYDVGRIGGMLETMAGIDLAAAESRAAVEAELQKGVPDWGLMKFLATNLDRDERGRFFWRVNVKALHAELAELAGTSLQAGDRYEGPTLFVAGGRSYHVRDEDRAGIMACFPRARITVLPDSGHNPHIEARAAFVDTVRSFLRDL
jgi:pimeloyl-ACP methyl ester carboxylesterase